MTVRLVDAGWGAELTDALRAGASALRVICPFIKVGALDRLLSLNLGELYTCLPKTMAPAIEEAAMIKGWSGSALPPLSSVLSRLAWRGGKCI